jgi:hypothetical protein
MPDNNDGNAFGVDLTEFGGSATRIKRLGGDVTDLTTNLLNVLNKYDNLGGNGDIGKLFQAKYYGPAHDCVDFLNNLNDLLNINGNTTNGLNYLFNDVNTDSTNMAGGPSHKR